MNVIKIKFSTFKQFNIVSEIVLVHVCTSVLLMPSSLKNDTSDTELLRHCVASDQFNFINKLKEHLRLHCDNTTLVRIMFKIVKIDVPFKQADLDMSALTPH